MARPQPERLIAAYLARHNRLRSVAGVAVGRLWDRTAGLDDTAAGRFTEVAAQSAIAAQTRAAANVDAYLAAMLALLASTGSPVGVDPALVTGAAVRAGADPLDVYHRSIVTARTAVAGGAPFLDAMRAGRARAVSTAETDVALAQRAATLEVVARDDRVVGYRRVLTGSSCALCATASAQRYRTDELMPIHNHCDCGVAPIIGNRDPGRTINDQLVSDMRAAAKTSGDPAYWQSRRITVDEDGTVRLPDVQVHDHGELGPVLTDRSQDFTGPADIAA